ncbi:hypothetical protein E2C01_080735 [Portunus trituberculatus]|uniref:Uncharacterized protein n=1 Tax=Portunus trituberculatus TaxID=210409 RepID=A0A5B7IUT3_PORTR|nr:hypothetical protein [Portunus trituberculatus]
MNTDKIKAAHQAHQQASEAAACRRKLVVTVPVLVGNEDDFQGRESVWEEKLERKYQVQKKNV